MIIEALCFAVYEITTTAVGVIGLKAISGEGLKKRMLSISAPRQLPVIDKYLKRQIGATTKTECYLANKIAKIINRMVQYQAFRSILILIARSAREKQLGKVGHSFACARGRHYWRLLVS